LAAPALGFTQPIERTSSFRREEGRRKQDLNTAGASPIA